MPSTYTTNLRTEQMATGENRSTWGTKANSVFQLLEYAITKQITVALSDANYSLTTNDGSDDEARCAGITFTGALTAGRTITIPAVDKIYLLYNNTSGSHDLTISNGTNSITLANGAKTFVFNDGTTIWQTIDLVAGTSGAKVPLLNGTNTWSGVQTFSTNATVGGTFGVTGAVTLSSTLGVTGASTFGNVSISGSLTLTTALPVAQGGTGATTAAGARTSFGLDTMATQAASAVAITGGTITGITDLAVADGGTGSSTASGARTNLGLGTMATQNSTAVSISGGTITGITDIAVADGGTGASTAAAARTSLFGVSTTTDNAVARYDGTTGALQNSGVTIDDSGNISTSGDITYASDAKLKENIRPIGAALSKVMALCAATYDRVDWMDHRHSAGLIAQDVERVFPEAVHRFQDGTLGVAPGPLLGLLVAAIQEIARDLTRQPTA